DERDEDGQSTKEGLMSRRFLLGVGGTGSLVSLVGPVVANVRFLFPNVVYEPSAVFKVGRPGDYPAGTSTFVADRKVYILHEPEGFRCLSAVCTHLRCTVDSFQPANDNYPFRHAFCPCHGSVFDGDGNVVVGPAPRPLEFYAIQVAPDGRLQVDANRRVAPTESLQP
ncbi:MAG: Rieske (2Fe-2S) protein, partial [Dehalococcoidia bacterium]